jgi:hypothetical protein
MSRQARLQAPDPHDETNRDLSPQLEAVQSEMVTLSGGKVSCGGAGHRQQGYRRGQEPRR